MNAILCRLALKLNCFGKNDFIRGIRKFKKSGFMPKEKFNFLLRYKKHLRIIDSLLYAKLLPKEQQVFIAWLFKRWITGGGGNIADEFWLTKVNLAFIEAEKLYNSRKTQESPVKFFYNNQEFSYYSHCPVPFFANTDIQSLSFYLIVHTFLLREYDKDGFNPNDGEVIFDCGGAEGDTALFFSVLYPNSPIYTFECADSSYTLLQKNLVANNKQEQIKAYKCAVGDKTQTLHFESWHIVPQKTDTSIEVDCVSIDDFVSQHNITNIGLIKMDIEGAEQDALLGARETIKRFKPKLMIPIYHLENDFIEIPKFLHSLNLPMEFSLKWTEIRVWGMDCVLFVRFI